MNNNGLHLFISMLVPATRGALEIELDQGVGSYNNQISNGIILFKAKELPPEKG